MLDSLNGQLAIALLQVLRYVYAETNTAAFRRTNNSHRRKQVSFHEEVLNNMESHAENSLATVLNSKIEIMETLRRQEASSSSTLHAQQSTLSRLCTKLEERDRVPGTKAGDKKTRKRLAIVDSLRFPDMRLRKDAIHLTYRKTFEWIFDEQREFKRWLELGNDIFWISGKAGSGKSTLMKFISDHASTRTMLRTWAAPLEPLILDFYFWYTGTQLQKSQEGLLRTILHDLFEKCPDLLPRAVPRRWNSPASFHQDPDIWSREELSQALRSIATMGDLKFKFCLFLDGLDEFSGDHRDLIADLRLLCSNSCIKICVSSRPWNVFVNAFGSLDTVLHLEELTADDIYQYAVGHLKAAGYHRSQPEVDDIIAEIVLKSQGVFFWVFLAVRSLVAGLGEGDSIKILQRRLSEMPSDLEVFFQSILTRLDRLYESETAQVLKLAMLTVNRDQFSREEGLVRHGWLDFWLLREFDFSDRDWAGKMNVRSCDASRLKEMTLDTGRFINATCKDFLFLGADGNVHFLHQTVHDFLSGTAIQALLDGRVPPMFQDPLIMLHVRLARCKILQTDTLNLDANDCFGRKSYPETLQNNEGEDLIFPGSSRLARMFEDAFAALLETCRGVVDGCHDSKCVFNQNWRILFLLLVANGRYATLLKVTEKHHSTDVEFLIQTATRLPRPCRKEGRDEPQRLSGSAEEVVLELSSEEFISELRARRPTTLRNHSRNVNILSFHSLVTNG